MPSLRTICMGLVLAPLLQLALAAPVAVVDAEDCPRNASGAPALPKSGDATELPATTLALKYVAIGRGIQNYTCASAGASPVAIGAIATLYDGTALASKSVEELHAIPPQAVNAPVPAGSLNANGASLKVLGHHFFDAAGTPSFELSSVNKSLFAAKVANIAAPSTASKGPGGHGAVDWLYLTAKPAYTSVGLGAVYRVVTAGGKAVCTQAGAQSVQYAAEYWFYG